MAYKALMNLPTRQSIRLLLALLCATGLTCPAAAQAGMRRLRDGAMGRTSRASIGISVSVMPRFVVRQIGRNPRTRAAPFATTANADQVCVDGSSGGPTFTIVEAGSVGRYGDTQRSAREAVQADASSCMAVDRDSSAGAAAAASLRRAADKSITLLIAAE